MNLCKKENMEKRIVGSGFLSLYNNKSGSIYLNAVLPLESLHMDIRVISSPYLTSNCIKIEFEALNNDSVIAEITLEKTEEEFVRIDYRKLPGVSALKKIKKINFFCAYDIEIEVKLVAKIIGFYSKSEKSY